MRANMRAFYRLLGERSPGGEVIECQGLVAAIVPSCPGRSIVNAVVYERPEELAAEREELARRYRRAGVRAWTVWVPEADRASAELLARTGHRLDGGPRAGTRVRAAATGPCRGARAWLRDQLAAGHGSRLSRLSALRLPGSVRDRDVGAPAGVRPAPAIVR